MSRNCQILTDKGARRCGHLSSKATHWLADLLNHKTMSRPRSWKGVGTRESRSSRRETGYQWSRHVNFEDSSVSSESGETTSFKKVGTSSSSSEEVIVFDGAVTRSKRRFESFLEEEIWVLRRWGERKGRGEKGFVKVCGVVEERENAITTVRIILVVFKGEVFVRFSWMELWKWRI